MNVLFHAHSGLRYLVLLFGVLAVVWFAIGWVTGRSFEGAGRGLFAAFLGTLDLQVLLGLVLLFGRLGVPGVWIHLVAMVSAAVVVHAAGVVQRTRMPGFAAPLVGVVVALGLIALGIGALGRPIV